MGGRAREKEGGPRAVTTSKLGNLLAEGRKAWLPDGYSLIFRFCVFGPSGFWTMAPLRYAANSDPFLFSDCAPTPSTLAQSKERDQILQRSIAEP